MKKTLKLFTVLTVMVLLLTVTTVPALATGFDFDAAIETFDSNELNSFILSIGATHTPTAAIWAQQGMATCYSSNENVVTVAADGTVTTVGTGTAYVAYDTGSMYQLYCYTVLNVAINEIEGPGNNDVNTEDLIVDPDNLPIGDLEIKPIDPNVQDITLPTIGVYEEGTIPTPGNNTTGNTPYIPQDDGPSPGLIIGLCIGIPATLALIYALVSALCLSVSSTKTKTLPFVYESPNTVNAASNRYVFPIRGRMRVQKFEKEFNQWLAENPYITDCKLHLDTRQRLLLPFVACKFVVKHAEITYRVSDTKQPQHGFAFLYKIRVFGSIGYSSEKLTAQWAENNPDYRIINTHSGHIQHFGRGGFYAQYYNYMFFKKN